MNNCPIIFVTLPYSALSNDTESFDENEIGVNILIDTGGIDLRIIYRSIKRFRFNFIISIAGEIVQLIENDKVIEKLYMLSTLSVCFRKHLNIIPVIINQSMDCSRGILQLNGYFIRQGEIEVRFPIFDKSFQGSLVSDGVMLLGSDVMSGLNDDSAENNTKEIPRVVICLLRDMNLVKDELLHIKQAIRENKYLGSMIERIYLRSDDVWLRREVDLWKQRSNLYYSFINLSKKVGEQQYYNVLDWYKNEYEVLPLWFKRVGHIVKFLYGKRKLSSFSNKKPEA